METVKKVIGMLGSIVITILKVGLVVGLIDGIVNHNWSLLIVDAATIAGIAFLFRLLSNELARYSVYIPLPEVFGIPESLREKGRRINSDLLNYNPFKKN